MQNSGNRKYNIRGILKEVKRREKEGRKAMTLVNKLCINDLKDSSMSIDLTSRNLRSED